MLNAMPMAFMSYAYAGDAQEEARLVKLRDRLAQEVAALSGQPFEILHDRKSMTWGRQWQWRIEGQQEAPAFLIPVITPAFFNSLHCRHELERFLARERALGHANLVLPIYYFDCAILNKWLCIINLELRAKPIQ